MEKVKIIWNGQGGELDSKVIKIPDGDVDGAITDALVEMIEGNIVSVGDSFVIEDAS